MTTKAPTANPRSKGDGAADVDRRTGGAVFGAGGAAAAERVAGTAVPAVAAADGGAAPDDEVKAGLAGEAEMAALGAPALPEGAAAPAGKFGSLMVGEAVGFGGKLIRTVSFFG